MKVVKYYVLFNIMFVIKDVRLRNGILFSLCKKNMIVLVNVWMENIKVVGYCIILFNNN